MINVSAEVYQEFISQLDAAPSSNEALRKTMMSKSLGRNDIEANSARTTKTGHLLEGFSSGEEALDLWLKPGQ